MSSVPGLRPLCLETKVGEGEGGGHARRARTRGRRVVWIWRWRAPVKVVRGRPKARDEC